MTTRTNNIKKSALKAGLFFLTIFISTGLFAQKSFTSLEIKNTGAALIKKSSEEILKAFNAKSEVFYEDEVDFESWMIDLEEFGKTLDSSSVIPEENENLEENMKSFEIENIEFLNEFIEIEDWMTETNWLLTPNENYIEEEEKIENWMLDPKAW